MPDVLQEYGVPFILALLVHACVGAALWAGWQSPHKNPERLQPNVVQAQLIQLKAKRSIQRKQLARKMEVLERAPAQPQRARTLPKPVAGKKPAVDQAKQKAEQKREQQKRLDSLLADSFDVALAEESKALVQSQEASVAASYARGIRRAIVANWSRPPSARNGMRVKLLVELIPTGDVVSVTVVESSGNEAFDRSAEVAVRKVGAFDVPKDSTLFEKNFRKLYLLFNPEDLMR